MNVIPWLERQPYGYTDTDSEHLSFLDLLYPGKVVSKLIYFFLMVGGDLSFGTMITS